MTKPFEPELDQILAFCAEDPIERVFLEDIARRGLGRFSAIEEDERLVSLCHVGANVVPSAVSFSGSKYVGAAAVARAASCIGQSCCGVSFAWSVLKKNGLRCSRS